MILGINFFHKKTRTEAGSFDVAVVIYQPVGIEIPSLRANLAKFIQKCKSWLLKFEN
jgi:hypothetical protein